MLFTEEEIDDLINALEAKEAKCGEKLEIPEGEYIPKNYYVKIPEGGMTNPNRFHKLSIKPKTNDAPEDSKMTIIANSKEEALVEALNLLGWNVCN